MKAPDWMNEAVQAFGRQLNLSTLALNEQGAAGLSFENGVSLRFEYTGEAMMMVAGLKADPDPESLARLLTDVHPSAPRGEYPVRAAYLSRTGELVFAAKLPERMVNVSVLQEAFTELWDRIQRLRRAI